MAATYKLKRCSCFLFFSLASHVPFALLNLSSFSHLYLPCCTAPSFLRPAPSPCCCCSLIHVLFISPRWPLLSVIAWRFHSLSLLSRSISYSHFSLSPRWTPSFIPRAPHPRFAKIRQRQLPASCPGHKRTEGSGAGGRECWSEIDLCHAHLTDEPARGLLGLNSIHDTLICHVLACTCTVLAPIPILSLLSQHLDSGGNTCTKWLTLSQCFSFCQVISEWKKITFTCDTMTFQIASDYFGIKRFQTSYQLANLVRIKLIFSLLIEAKTCFTVEDHLLKHLS